MIVINQIVVTIISTLMTGVIIPLIILLGQKLIAWLKLKVKNEKVAMQLEKAISIVINSVKCVGQTYVSSLKKSDSFDAQAQQQAFDAAKDSVLKQITAEIKNSIESNFGDFDEWLRVQIECSVKNLKEKSIVGVAN